jgi:hypothetical protein
MIIRPSSKQRRWRDDQVDFNVAGERPTERYRLDATFNSCNEEASGYFGPVLRHATQIRDQRCASTLHLEDIVHCRKCLEIKAKKDTIEAWEMRNGLFLLFRGRVVTHYANEYINASLSLAPHASMYAPGSL